MACVRNTIGPLILNLIHRFLYSALTTKIIENIWLQSNQTLRIARPVAGWFGELAIKSMTNERHTEESIVDEVKRVLESEVKRGYPSFWHADNDTQSSMEVGATRSWAEELNKRGCAIRICTIRKNSEKFPDCTAEIDGRKIGVEVTELTVTDKERKQYVKAVDNQKANVFPAQGVDYNEQTKDRVKEAQSSRLKTRVPSTPGWGFESFRKKIEDIVKKKDKKAQHWNEKGKLESIDEKVLLIVKDEQNLSEDKVDEYLDAITVPRAKHFDKIYLMLSYQPGGDDGNGCYPVFDVMMI